MLIKLIIIQTILFGAVIFFLRKMTVGDTDSAVSRLNESYSDMNKKKEELVARMHEIENEYNMKKQEAEKIVSQMRDEADKEIVKKKDETFKKAKEEAERIVADAMSAKEKVREDIRKEEEMRMVDYCADLYRRLFGDSVQDSVDAVLVEDFIAELNNMDMTKTSPDIKEAEIVARRELGAKEKEAIAVVMQEKLGRKIELKTAVDENVLGGLMIKFGSLVLDNSIRGKLSEAALNRKNEIESRT
ncbi:MAG: F0F1 ATP synthase subunit delta [Candidatus Omnitrophota bacterium]